MEEEFLIKRYDVKTGTISYKRNCGGNYWKPLRANIFGATIIVRRTPFQDPALTSRSIMIRTQYKVGNYDIRPFKKVRENLDEMAEEVTIDRKSSERTHDN